jgi:integrase
VKDIRRATRKRHSPEEKIRIVLDGLRGETLKPLTFKQVFQYWRSSLGAELKDKPTKARLAYVRQVEIHALAYLKDYNIDEIDEGVLADYIQWRIKTAKKPPASATLRNERTYLNQLFRYAKRKRFISEVPTLELPTARPNARPDIPDDDYKKLYTYLRHYVKKAQDKRRHRERIYLQHYILILANTGIRVGEARNLRWRDVSSTKTLSGDKRLVFTVRGKTGEREVVCNQNVERYIDRLKEQRLTETNTLKLDEPIFCHIDGTPIGSFKKGFNRVLKEAGVLKGSDGKRRVPYSLRHTYATMRISEGVSVFQLAANMGTSVEMIGTFYGKKRMRDPKMATEVTKFNKAPRKR